ncbi:GntR family transcriptional regulator [Nonomuraea sp. NPDC050478]|uniref:GntR family transcriptional regulator n=1 Tax=Nonomuraea sp. NPDC050478 TaxID=3364365 RepID=UPI003798EABF
MREGDQLPSIPDLVREHGITSGTAQWVVRVLVTEGLVISKPGSGTYVRARPPIRSLVRSWHANLGRAMPSFDSGGDAIGSIGYRSTTVDGPAAVRDRLGLGPLPDGERPDLMKTTYTRKAAGEPVYLETSWEPLTLTRDTVIALPEDGPYGGRGVAERMRQIGVHVTHAPEVVSARAATVEEARALDIAAGDIVLRIERTHYAETRPVETADIILPVDRYQLVYGLCMWDEPADSA